MSVEPLTGYDNEDQDDGQADHEVFEYSAETGQLVCASCDPGGARPLGSAFIGATLDERASTPFHQPRSLSDDGSRLFFSSPDPLVPGLAGGSVKVFEYEDGARPAHLRRRKQAAKLCSSTPSASGNDVFFATREQLAPDRRRRTASTSTTPGSTAACPQPRPPSPVSRAAPARNRSTPPPSFAPPVSASFTGSGNLVRLGPAARS